MASSVARAAVFAGAGFVVCAAVPAYAGNQLADIEAEIQLLCERLRPTVAGIEAWGAERPVTVGSGVVLDTSGVILTTASVVRDAREIGVRIADRGRFAARLLGHDTITNLAVIKVEGAGLEAAPLAKTAEPSPGSWVMILGNSYGSGPTVSAGMLAGRRPCDGLSEPGGLLQVSAAVNPGDSGAPLVNSRGEVIGIVCAAITPSPDARAADAGRKKIAGNVWSNGATVGFAVPIRTAQEIAREIVASGRVARGFLGVQIRGLTEEEAALLGPTAAAGLVVTHVVARSPAAAAGMQVGDRLIAINGTPVGSPREVQRFVTRMRPDTPLRVSIARDSSIAEINVRVGVRPDDLVEGEGRPAPAEIVPAPGRQRPETAAALRQRVEMLERELGALRAEMMTHEADAPQ
jgi:serine protease Do